MRCGFLTATRTGTKDGTARFFAQRRAIYVTTAAIVLSLSGAAARAQPPPEPCEPSVRTLQQAAVRRAEAQPERVVGWLARVRKAALLPGLHVRVGRGLGAVVVSRDLDGLERYTTTANDAWR